MKNFGSLGVNLATAAVVFSLLGEDRPPEQNTWALILLGAGLTLMLLK